MMKDMMLSAVRGAARLKVLQGRGLRSNGTFNFFVDTALRALLPKNIRDVEIQGSRMIMDLENPNPALRRTYQAYYLMRAHEETSTTIFKKLIKQGDRVLDLGANIGYFSLLAARLVGPAGKVYAVEPEPTNFGYLKRNIELNGYANVQAFNMAVSDRKQKMKLSVCSFDSGHHSLNRGSGRGAREIDVDVETADELIGASGGPIDFVKMDIEGSEPFALMGMRKTIAASKSIKIIMEFYPKMIRAAGFEPEALLKMMIEEMGLSVYVISDDYGAQSGKHLRIRKPSEVMDLCAAENAHINLFVEKGRAFEEHFPVHA